MERLSERHRIQSNDGAMKRVGHGVVGVSTDTAAPVRRLKRARNFVFSRTLLR